MCGRYSLFTTEEELESRFDATFEFEFEPRYNAAPGQSLPVITDDQPNRVRRMKWGLVPGWADDTTESYINARSETVGRKPAFSEAYDQRRCLVPADGFYEWTQAENENRPYRVAFQDDRPFAMAGLYERWTPSTKQTGLSDFTHESEGSTDVESLETFTVLTTEPNGVVEPLHNRMAVILDAEDESRWLGGDDVPFDPAPDDGFRAYPVSEAVNNPGNDRPELVRPIEG